MRSLLLLGLLAGCADGLIPDDRFDCTAEMVPSTIVTVVDELGGAIPSATVTHTLEDGVPTACDDEGRPGVFVCGWEQRGLITIAADATGHTEELAAVTVSGDACHVETKFVTLTLPELNCPDVERPAVLVSPVDSSGNPVADATVDAIPVDANWTAPEPCETQNNATWSCLPQMAGEIEIGVTSPTVGTWYDVVSVPSDECGPITQSISPVVE